MAALEYFDWLVKETPTTWWHDSANPEELAIALGRGASGVTTNPLLTAQTLKRNPEHWKKAASLISQNLAGDERAEACMRMVIVETAEKLLPVFSSTRGRLGHVCAQVNPEKAGDRESMLAQARHRHTWAQNIAVKLPATAAGLDVLEECAAEGITTAITVSFTVAQVVAAAERFQRGAARAQSAGKPDCRCFPVLMIGRLDDYLLEIAIDRKAVVEEGDLQQAGLAVAKRAFGIFKQHRYEATLLIAALRGVYHMTNLAGADLVMSISPDIQTKLLQPEVPLEEGIQVPIAPRVIERLQRIPEFVKAFEPERLKPEEFISYGLTQRTLTQFTESGWKLLKSLGQT